MPVQLAKIRIIGLAMIEEGYDMIRELAFGKELPAFDLSEIIDSMAWSSEFRRSDYSFINYVDRYWGLRHIYWQVAKSGTIQLNCSRYVAILGTVQLN